MSALPASAQQARPDPARDRLFISPTARSVGGGTTRLSTYYIFPSVAHGIHDRVDVEAGLFVLPIVDDVYALANVNAKVQLTERDGLATAVGTNAFVPLSGSSGQLGGTFYGLATMENEAGALTLGAFGAYVTDFEDDTNVGAAALLIGLEKPVSNHVRLMSETYVLLSFNGGEVPIGTLSGFRHISGRVASDFALGVTVSREGLGGPVPYLGLSYTF